MSTIVLARIGNDPELRYTPGNDSTAVMNLSLAVQYGRRDPQTGKRPVQWYDATLWGKRAESLAEFMVKGQLLHVQLTDVHIEEFSRRDKTIGTKLAARVADLELAGPPPLQQAAPQQSAPRQNPPQQGRGQRQAPPPPAPPAAFDDFDDDIPFD